MKPPCYEMMEKKYCRTLFHLLLLSIIISNACAQDIYPVVSTGTEIRNSVGGFTCNVFCIFTYAAGALAALVIIVAGFRYMIATDVYEKNNAKKTVIYAFLGLVMFVMIIPAINLVTSYISTFVTPFNCNCETLEFEIAPPTTTLPPALSATIIKPRDFEEYEVGENIRFIGKGFGGNPPYTYSWFSDIDGDLGDLDQFTRTLTRENHTIMLDVMDSNSTNATDSVRINVVVPKPTPGS